MLEWLLFSLGLLLGFALGVYTAYPHRRVRIIDDMKELENNAKG